MKECPKCHRRYDDTMNFCIKDGCQLVGFTSGEEDVNKLGEINAHAKKKKHGWVKTIAVSIIVLALVCAGVYSYVMNAASYITMDPNQITLPKKGDYAMVDIDYDGYVWNIVHHPTWLYTDKFTNDIRITACENKSGQNREGTITVRSGKQTAQVVVRQLGFATSIKFSETSVHFSKEGGSKCMRIETDGCDTRYTHPDWITVTTDSSGKMEVKCEKNNSEYRSYIIVLSEDNVSATLQVTQGGKCNICHGDGEIVCGGCNGIGGSGFGMFYTTCYMCGGTGQKTCSTCNGTGSIK